MDGIWMAMSNCQVPLLYASVAICPLFPQSLQYYRCAIVEAMFHSRFPAKAREGPKAGIKCQIFPTGVASVRRGRRLAPFGIGCRGSDVRLPDQALHLGNARTAIGAGFQLHPDLG